MRILILNHNDKDKGTFFRCLFLGKYLCKAGNEVVLSCLNPERGIRTKKTEDESVEIFLLVGQHGSSSLFELPYHLLRSLLNIRLALFGGFDVIYSFNVASPTTGMPIVFLKLLKKLGLFKKRLVVDWDDWWGSGGLTSIDNKGRLIEGAANIFETKIPPLADMVTVVSDTLKEHATNIGITPSKIINVPNGANVGAWCSIDQKKIRNELGLPDEANILCFAGRVLTIFDNLIKSINLIVKKAPNTVVLIIAPLKNSHLTRISDLGLKNNIIYLGVQPYEVLLHYLRASDILLLPRVDNYSERANYPGRLGDYLASGRPIVTNPIGQIERVINDNHCGLIAKINDAEDFAEKVIELINDPELSKQMGDKGQKIARDLLAWPIIVEKLNQALASSH